eukprot:365941-Chlamydomonas_euryale.AAC.2
MQGKDIRRRVWNAKCGAQGVKCMAWGARHEAQGMSTRYEAREARPECSTRSGTGRQQRACPTLWRDPPPSGHSLLQAPVPLGHPHLRVPAPLGCPHLRVPAPLGHPHLQALVPLGHPHLRVPTPQGHPHLHDRPITRPWRRAGAGRVHRDDGMHPPPHLPPPSPTQAPTPA